MPPLDHDRCYAAAVGRDARFDGQFVTAVRTTGIYCRPSCPALTPRRENVEFHHTAAAAQQRGFRACKRCLPDATPGSPDWDTRRDVVGRAMRLIADGEIERSGVSGLARRLGYSTRHLTRLITDDLGAGPLSIARAQRAHTARILIETTAMRLTDVAFAAGFGSVRQFNDTIREVYASSPSDLRSSSRHRTDGAPDSARSTALRLRLAHRAPLAALDLGRWFAARAVDGIETVDLDGPSPVHTRAIAAPYGAAVVSATFGAATANAFDVALRLEDPRDLAVVVQRLRRMYDLDADPHAVDDRLGGDPLLAGPVAARPGLRSPGSVDAFETVVRTVIGQQISLGGARTVTARLVERAGRRLAVDQSTDPRICSVFPTPERLADAPDEAFSMLDGRRDTIRSVAAAVAEGRLVLDAASDAAEAADVLRSIRGIGPWTAGYVAMRAFSDPDVLLGDDLVAARSAGALGLDRGRLAAHAAVHWAPWRSYATHHLWAVSASSTVRSTA